MDNNIKIFDNPEFGQLRTFVEEDKVLYCAKDVAVSLGYSNPRKAINDHCRYVTKRDVPSLGKSRYGAEYTQYKEMSFIPESNVYRLIVKNKLPSAEKFERWVFDEVLPDIRKHGMYMTDNLAESIMNSPETVANIILAYAEEKKKR